MKEGKVQVIGEGGYATYYKGGLSYEQGLNGRNFAITFGSRDDASRYTADQVIQNIKNYYKPSTLTALLKGCGLIA